MDRMKTKARWLWNNRWHSAHRVAPPEERWIGRMASTHNKPCSCVGGCGHLRQAVGPTIQELRSANDNVDVLADEETAAQIAREVEALTCDDPDCDCKVDWEEWEEFVYEVVTGETAKKLEELNVTVTWAA
jgi:hypothetical protein